MATIEQTKKRVMRVATVKPLSGSEIHAKLKRNHPGEYEDPRSFGRPLGQLVSEGKLIKDPPQSRPKYRKP